MSTCVFFNKISTVNIGKMREYSCLPSWEGMLLMSPQIKIWLVLNIESKFLMCFSIEIRFKIGIDMLMKNRRIVTSRTYGLILLLYFHKRIFLVLRFAGTYYFLHKVTYLFPRNQNCQKKSIILNSINKTCSNYGISHQTSPQVINK